MRWFDIHTRIAEHCVSGGVPHCWAILSHTMPHCSGTVHCATLKSTLPHWNPLCHTVSHWSPLCHTEIQYATLCHGHSSLHVSLFISVMRTAMSTVVMAFNVDISPHHLCFGKFRQFRVQRQFHGPSVNACMSLCVKCQRNQMIMMDGTLKKFSWRFSTPPEVFCWWVQIWKQDLAQKTDFVCGCGFLSSQFNKKIQ